MVYEYCTECGYDERKDGDVEIDAFKEVVCPLCGANTDTLGYAKED